MRELDQEMQERTQHGPHSDARDPEGFRQNRHPDHDPDLVHRRSQSGEKEIAVRIQDPHDQPADPEDQHRRQLDPQQFDRQDLQLRIMQRKSGDQNVFDDLLRENKTERTEEQQHQEQAVADAGCQHPRFFLLILPVQHRAERRDKSARKCTAGHQVENRLRQPVGRQIRVYLRRSPESRSQHSLGDKPADL